MAAVSRHREYLADASAVQFTRNPDGIGGALKKIGGLAEGSRIDNPQAAEAGHMFFANAFAGEGLAGLLATHPPLVERIRRLDPQFDGQFPEVRPVGVDREEPEGPRPGRVPPFAGMPRLPGLPQVMVPVLGFADDAASRVGHVDPEVRTSATTSESLCAWAPCGDVTRGGGIPGVAIRQYAVWHDRHASDSRTLGYFRLEAR